MCGIVGYVGKRKPQDVLLAGLKRLEYRGYDSAGVSIFHEGKIKRIRANGKLSELQKKLENESFDGHLGIGHTRWATHGIPCEKNAHPHKAGSVTIVHNGIIENYEELKNELKLKKACFESDTDSELLAHLIFEQLKETNDLCKAVRNMIPMIRGAYAVLVFHEDEPDHIVAFKNGPPLIIGVGVDETFIASDVQALLPYTNKVIYLDDDEMASVSSQTNLVYSARGFVIEKNVNELQWSADLIEKQGYQHFMLKEIYEQPRAVATAIDSHINLDTHRVELSGINFSSEKWSFDYDLSDHQKNLQVFKTIDRVFIIACGTSYYAAMYGEYLIENLAQLPVEVDFASEFRYRKPVIPSNSLVIFISQSGETADTIAALRKVKEKNAICLSICNVKASTLDRETHGNLYMNSGPEIGVASTKALMSTLALLNLIALEMAVARNQISVEQEKKSIQALLSVPSQIEKLLAFDKYFNEAAEILKNYRGFLYLGRGINFPIVLEGALKLKELAYMHAEGYAAGEMKHGPLALIDDRMIIVVVAPSDKLFDKTLSNLEEAKARGGVILSIGTGENEKLKALSQYYLSIPEADWTLNPLLALVPLQLLAYHLADSLGHDVDQPRNLAKSVTVE